MRKHCSLVAATVLAVGAIRYLTSEQFRQDWEDMKHIGPAGELLDRSATGPVVSWTYPESTVGG